MRAALAGFSAIVLLAAAGCGEEEKPPPSADAGDKVTVATSNIVFQCRAVERGFLSSVPEDVLMRDVDALVEAAEEFDPDTTFRRPSPAVEPETTIRDQVELAIARLEDGCSPEDAERLRDAIDD